VHVERDLEMNKSYKIKLPAKQQGIVLLEGLIAVLIFSIGILGIVGLQAAMIKGTSDSKYRIDAGYVAQQRIAAIWVDPNNLANYAESGTDISASSGLPNGKRSTLRADPSCDKDASNNPSDKCFVVKVTWQPPGSTEVHNVTTVAHIAGGV
jgi:type IV pilus assembly protein PilV